MATPRHGLLVACFVALAATATASNTPPNRPRSPRKVPAPPAAQRVARSLKGKSITRRSLGGLLAVATAASLLSPPREAKASLGETIENLFLYGPGGLANADKFEAKKSAAEGPSFRRIPTQFIAALGDPKANSGSGAQEWGLWRLDPGPRGVWLTDYPLLKKSGGVAPASWKFDPDDWWLEEHGLIMEKPDFPLSPGRYLVTGGRAVTTVLTVHPADAKGQMRWELDSGSLYDVTHLPCRSARYTPMNPGSSDASPSNARLRDFPVSPGAEMPAVEGFAKQDYAVLFVIGVESPRR